MRPTGWCLALVLISGCDPGEDPAPARQLPDVEYPDAECEVYATLLACRDRRKGLPDIWQDRRIILRAEALTGVRKLDEEQYQRRFDFSRKPRTKRLLTRSLLDAFVLVNRNERTLPAELDFGHDVTIVGTAELDAVFGPVDAGYYDRFHERFGESACLVGFSRVAFSDDGNTAYTQWGVTVRELHATGGYALLARSDSGWEIVEVVGTMAS